MPHQPTSRTVDGSSTAILFVHGIVGTPDHFLDLLPLIPDSWSYVNILLPGHGGSVGDFSRSSMALWRKAVTQQGRLCAGLPGRRPTRQQAAILRNEGCEQGSA